MSDAVPPDLMRELLAAATLAPSSHNTQPWSFRVADAHVDVLADRTRALPVNDPDDRELVMSCGCALFNLRAAAAARGLDAVVHERCDIRDPDRLARVELRPAADAGPDAAAERSRLAALADAIERRRTVRHRFTDGSVRGDAIGRLEQAAAAEGGWLAPVPGETERVRIAAMVGEGDGIQWANPSWRRELAAWMHPRRRGDGLTVPAFAGPAARMVVRTFDMGGGVAAHDRHLAEGSPFIAILGSDGDDEADRLRAGQALERVLLTVTAEGLQASYLNQPVQVPALRKQLRELVGGGFPQAILRVGRMDGDLPSAPPRRPVEAVLETGDGSGSLAEAKGAGDAGGARGAGPAEIAGPATDAERARG